MLDNHSWDDLNEGLWFDMLAANRAKRTEVRTAAQMVDEDELPGRCKVDHPDDDFRRGANLADFELLQLINARLLFSRPPSTSGHFGNRRQTTRPWKLQSQATGRVASGEEGSRWRNGQPSTLRVRRGSRWTTRVAGRQLLSCTGSAETGPTGTISFCSSGGISMRSRGMREAMGPATITRGRSSLPISAPTCFGCWIISMRRG